MAELGKLTRIDAREVWSHEAHDFTPWLKEHIELLGEALGLDLDLVQAEVRVGPFAADLVAKDVSGDQWVVIENQLGPTDHSHLGQLLTYGAGTEAGVFVWIAPEFREEHRAAMDWLNEHSDEDSHFFGVVIELLSIDDSNPAPNFRLVSFPNEWQKTTKAARVSESGKGLAYLDFYSGLLSEFKEQYPNETNVSKAQPANWLGLSIGKAGLGTNWTFLGDNRCRVELYIDTGNVNANKAYFDQLCGLKEDIERDVGHMLEWDEVEGRRVSRVYSYYAEPISIDSDQAQLELFKKWAVPEMKRLRDAFRPHIQKLRLNVSPSEES